MVGRRLQSAGCFTCLCRQQSAGIVAIASRAPRDLAAVDHDYLAAQADIDHFADAHRAMQALLATPPFARCGARLVDADGPGDVRGRCGLARVEGLRVADSSVFPDTIMHNTNLACYVVGEKLAEMIRAEA
jgi:hypothetical protein